MYVTMGTFTLIAVYRVATVGTARQQGFIYSEERILLCYRNEHSSVLCTWHDGELRDDLEKKKLDCPHFLIQRTPLRGLGASLVFH